MSSLVSKNIWPEHNRILSTKCNSGLANIATYREYSNGDKLSMNRRQMLQENSQDKKID
jgi:hypothetical protein